MAGIGNQRRGQLLINKSVQKRIITAVILVPTIGLAATTVVVAVFCRRLLAEMLLAEVELPSLVPLFLSVLGFCLVCSLVMAIQGLRFSHHVAGPAYRLCKSLERVRAGEWDFRVRLRRGDYLGEIADELNELLEWLESNPPAGPGSSRDQDARPVASSDAARVASGE